MMKHLAALLDRLDQHENNSTLRIFEHPRRLEATFLIVTAKILTRQG